MNRNYFISLLKLVLAYSVALGHLHLELVFFEAGYCVDYFFIISGFFLAGSFYSNKYASAGIYTMHRVKTIYSRYLFSFFVLFLYSYFSDPRVNFISKFIDSLPEILLLQNVGWFNGGINYPLWFLCDLIIVSHILFAMLVENDRLTLNVICPIISLLVGTYLMNVYQDHTITRWGVEFGFLYIPLCRCACFLSVGMIVYGISSRYCAQIFKTNDRDKKEKCLLYCVTCIVLLLFLYKKNTGTSYLLFIILFILSFSFYPDNRSIKKTFDSLSRIIDKISFQIFLNHAFIIYVTRMLAERNSWSNSYKITFLFLILLSLFSALSEWLIAKVINRWALISR